MNTSHARSILQSVAAGAISPAEAAVLLDALPPSLTVEEGGTTEPVADLTDTAPLPESGGDDETTAFEAPRSVPETGAASRVRLDLRGGPITVVGDPEIAVPSVDGPAASRVSGDATAGFVVDARLGDDSVIMVPGNIDLTVDARGSTFQVTGINGSVSAELNVGDVLIDGLFTAGESRIEANAGDVELRLQPGSDVEVISTAPATMHADGLEHTGRGRWSLGDGTAKFEIAGNLGSITVTAL